MAIKLVPMEGSVPLPTPGNDGMDSGGIGKGERSLINEIGETYCAKVNTCDVLAGGPPRYLLVKMNV